MWSYLNLIDIWPVVFDLTLIIELLNQAIDEGRLLNFFF